MNPSAPVRLLVVRGTEATTTQPAKSLIPEYFACKSFFDNILQDGRGSRAV